MAQQGGLGRGLSSLIPSKKQKQNDNKENYFGSDVKEIAKDDSQGGEKSTGVAEDQQAQSKQKIGNIALKSIMEVPIDAISPNPHQPREDFNESGLQELANSIREHGVLHPLIVSVKGSGGYELIAGERRLKASKIAGLEKIPIVVKDVNEQNKAELSLIENIQRYDLNPIEEAKAYEKLRNTFSITQDEIALRIGKSRSTVSNILRLLYLPIEIQKALINKVVTEGHARSILAISNPEKQRALFDLIVRESLTVRQTEDKVREVVTGTRVPKKRHINPDIQKYEEQLSQTLGTKVRIKKSKTGGQIIINYYSDEEFNALLTNLSQER
ncbi:MAG: ParB/RepB/Spo0J family partition protein [Patescibacteria group bacterium]|nr:ParB/RepB/Spo0J family partition protein [Patescibacteria group bacterium]